MSDWWFGIFFIFPYIGNNHLNWLIFFRGVETTNQMGFSIDIKSSTNWLSVFESMDSLFQGFNWIYTIWLFNIAMEHPQNIWRFLAGKTHYKSAIYTRAMLNNQRVIIMNFGCLVGGFPWVSMGSNQPIYGISWAILGI